MVRKLTITLLFGAMLLTLAVIYDRAADAATTPTLYVHGIIASGGCPGQSGKQAAKIATVTGPLVQVDYYCGDHDGVSIRNAGAGHCDSLDPAPKYNADTPIERIACDLSWYIYNTYGTNPVNLLGYSLGGLIIRDAFNYAPISVNMAVTISTPHRGIDKNTSSWTTPLLGCGSYTQCKETLPTSDFITTLNARPLPPVAWRLIGGGTKDIMTAASSLGLPGTVRINYYASPYSHSSYLTDLSLAKDIAVKYTLTNDTTSTTIYYRPLKAVTQQLAQLTTLGRV